MAQRTKSTAQPKAKPPVLPEEIGELSVLEKISHAPILVAFELRGKMVQVRGRRLKPCEAKDIQLLVDGALPPMLPAKDGEPERYDLRDPDYLRTKESKRRTARALALWSAFPLFKEGWLKLGVAQGTLPDPAVLKAAPKKEPTPEEITEFVESRELEDDLLEILFSAICERQVARAHVGFS